MTVNRIRWSDQDKYLGPFTYARERGNYRPLALVLGSGGDDDYPGCRLRFSGFGHTIIVALPAIIKPYRRKIAAETWSPETVARLGRDWYWDTHERQYGFSCVEGHLNISLGRQTDDSGTEQRWGMFLPWAQWRHVRHSLYGLQGEHYWTEMKGQQNDFNALHVARESCPWRTFAFRDVDGETLTARTIIEEREWRFGEGWFKWLSILRRPMILRSLDIRFSGETGGRKGSWKGGTIGSSIDMAPGELHEAAFRRYCAQHALIFVSPSSYSADLSAPAP